MLLTAEMLKELVNSLRSAARLGEKRQKPRVGLRAYAHAILPGERKVIEVGVRDVGPMGMGLMCPQALAPGQTIQLACKRASGKTQLITCVVRYCRKTGGPKFSIGVAFQSEFQMKAAA